MPISGERKDDLSSRSFLGVEYDTKNPIVITEGFTSDDNRNHCTARGWITRDTFLSSYATNNTKSQNVNWEGLIRLSSSTALHWKS